LSEVTVKKCSLVLAAAFLTACQQLPPVQPQAMTKDGHRFAQRSCASCHAIERHGSSPDPFAPPFAAVVNRDGVTAETLSAWLKEAHNYPDEMQFALDQDKVDELVKYMLTLRDPNFRPPI
jgi:mono/diheme cytochrome c family protein